MEQGEVRPVPGVSLATQWGAQSAGTSLLLVHFICSFRETLPPLPPVLGTSHPGFESPVLACILPGNQHPSCARPPVVPRWPCPEPSRRHGLGGKGQAQAMSSPNPQDNVYSRGGCPSGAKPVRTLMAHSRQRCHGEHGPQGLPAPKRLEFRRSVGEGRRKGGEPQGESS